MDIKLWMKEDLDLHIDHLRSSFKFIYPKVQDLCTFENISSFSHNFMSNIAKLKICIFPISNNQSSISKILKVVGPLGEKFTLFSPLRLKSQSNFDLETTKSKLQHTVRTVKGSLNEKNLIRGRKTAAI